MPGEYATKLIRHIHRDQGDLIPPYEYQLVEEILRESDELFAENLRTSQSAAPTAEPCSTSSSSQGQSTSDKNNENINDSLDDLEFDREESNQHDDIDLSEKEIMVMQVRHTAKLWNKRAIIVYHYERLNRLKKLRWEYGTNLPREIVQNLTKEELDWFTKYNDNLFSYMSALNDGQGLDLTLCMKPPKRLNVGFKCLKDYGQFEVDGETRFLKKNHIYFFPLKQCERLIQQGVLEHI